MRCKNCGTNNDESRYICENCGSPLYDENDDIINETDNATKAFAPIEDEPESTESDSAVKKNVIVIAVLAVILVAIITSIIVFAVNKNDDEKTTDSSTSITTTTESTTNNDYTTTESTTKETTTTTTTTTTETTTVQTWYINTSSSGGGTVTGDGEYKNGEKVVIKAIPDDDYVFDGWYSNGVKVSSSTSYKFTANENASFSAVFNPIEIEPDQPIEEIPGGME